MLYTLMNLPTATSTTLLPDLHGKTSELIMLRERSNEGENLSKITPKQTLRYKAFLNGVENLQEARYVI